jgi:hypothetical protein
MGQSRCHHNKKPRQRISGFQAGEPSIGNQLDNLFGSFTYSFFWGPPWNPEPELHHSARGFASWRFTGLLSPHLIVYGPTAVIFTAYFSCSPRWRAPLKSGAQRLWVCERMCPLEEVCEIWRIVSRA